MSGDHFITPPPFGEVGEYTSDLSTVLGSTLRIQWNASYANSSLWLIKDGDGLLCKELNLAKTWCHAILPSMQNTMQYDWTVSTYDLAYNASVPAYFLEVRSNPLLSAGSASIGSHYFNILPAQGASSSAISSSISSSASSSRISSATSVSSSTSIVSSTISSASSAITSSKASSSLSFSPSSYLSSHSSSASSGATPTPTPTPAVASSTGLTTGTKAAIGASVGIGVPLVAILLAILIVMTRRKKNRDNRQTSPTPMSMSTSDMPPSYTGTPHAPAELGKTGTTSVYPRQEMEAPVHVPQQQQYYQHQAGPRWELPS